jgi:predicted Zn-dependent protease
LNYLTKKTIIIPAALLLILAILFVGYNKLSAGDKVDKQLELGIKYLSENKYEEAVLAYREVIKIDKKNVPAYKGLSVAYTLQEKPDQAEQALQDGLKQVTASNPLKLALAGLLFDHNKKDQAESIYKEIITIDGSYLPAYQAYARMLVSLNRQKDAVVLLEKAAAGNAGQYRISSLLAEQYIKAGSKDKAIVAINQSISSEPNQAASYKLLEDLYNGRWTELNALGDQYIQQGKSMPGQIIRLTGLYKLGRYDEMIKQFNQLTGDLKASPKICLLAAQAYSKLGQKEQGISLSREVKPESIKDSALIAEIANFYLEAGDKATARSLALKGISLDDTVIDNYIVLSKSYQDEDKSQSDIWLTKCILGSVFSVKDTKREQEAQNTKQSSQKSTEIEKKDDIKSSTIKTISDSDFILNGIYRGMPYDAVITQLGKPLRVEMTNNYKYLYYDNINVCIDITIYQAPFHGFLPTNSVRWIETESAKFSSTRGIKAGDSIDMIQALYGNGGKIMGNIIIYSENFSDSTNKCISFIMENQKVKRIMVGSLADFND